MLEVEVGELEVLSHHLLHNNFQVRPCLKKIPENFSIKCFLWVQVPIHLIWSSEIGPVSLLNSCSTAGYLAVGIRIDLVEGLHCLMTSCGRHRHWTLWLLKALTPLTISDGGTILFYVSSNTASCSHTMMTSNDNFCRGFPVWLCLVVETIAFFVNVLKAGPPSSDDLFQRVHPFRWHLQGWPFSSEDSFIGESLFDDNSRRVRHCSHDVLKEGSWPSPMSSRRKSLFNDM